MPDEVRKATVQVRPPKGTFPGEIAESWYVVFEGNVILDRSGRQTNPERSQASSDAGW